MSDKVEHPPVPEAFAALGVRNSILRALAEASFTTPSEIQSLLIPRALAGVDLLGQARTGTGKTAAFGIPILQQAVKGLATQAIILVPTRELAVQVEEEVSRLGKFTPIRSVAVYGGQKITAQMKFLKHGPEVLVGTPGRVIDLLERRIIDFRNVRFVVLDEVDRMLDIGFRDDIRNILSRVKGVRSSLPADSREGEFDRSSMGLNRRASLAAEYDDGSRDDPSADDDDDDSHDQGGSSESRTDRLFGKGQGVYESEQAPESAQVAPPAAARGDRSHQTIFVSATISDEIEKLSRRYMSEPIEKLIAPGADEKPTVEKVEQFYFSVQPWDKYRLLRALLERENPDLAIVFCRTKRGAEKLAKKLHADGIECREIHGNLNQAKRDRVMKNFRTGKFDVLVATDLASRGIDVADISHIINYDIPEDPEAYVHRVGRTARMGATGKAFTFVSKDQGDELTKVENLINMVVPQATLEGWEPRPTPADWTDAKPGADDPAPRAAPNRFQQVYGQSRASQQAAAAATSAATAPAGNGEEAAPAPAAPPVSLPPRTLGSKIPITRRHKRRR